MNGGPHCQGISGNVLFSACGKALFPLELPPLFDRSPATYREGPEVRFTEQDMYAVIESGGKQHRVEPGEVLRLEKLDVATGETVDFDKILMVAEGDNVNVGTPYVSGGKVSAEVVTHGRGDKVKIIKFNRRKHHRKQMGHRQWFTEVRITGIEAG